MEERKKGFITMRVGTGILRFDDSGVVTTVNHNWEQMEFRGIPATRKSEWNGGQVCRANGDCAGWGWVLVERRRVWRSDGSGWGLGGITKARNCK